MSERKLWIAGFPGEDWIPSLAGWEKSRKPEGSQATATLKIDPGSFPLFPDKTTNQKCPNF